MLLSDSVREHHEQSCSVREDKKGPEGATSTGSARANGTPGATGPQHGGQSWGLVEGPISSPRNGK